MRTLWLGESCNNHCSFCWKDVLSLVRARDGMAALEALPGAASPHERLLIAGVEPSLRKDIGDIIASARSKGYAVSLRSNGRLFTYPEQCRRFLDAGVSSFIVYLLGSSARHHDAVTESEGSFSQSMQGLRNLRAAGAAVELELWVCGESRFDAGRVSAILHDAALQRVWLRYVGNGMLPLPLTANDFFEGTGERLHGLLTELRAAGVEVWLADTQPDVERVFSNIPCGVPARAHGLTREQNRSLVMEDFSTGAVVTAGKPLRLFIELTKNCNLRCVMCRVPDRYDASLDMPYETFTRLADELFPCAEYVDLRGWGESTIMRDWERYLDYALGFDTRFGLVTNLTVRNDGMWRKIARAGFSLSVSLDGATKETFESIRRRASFEGVLSNLRKVAGYYREYGINPYRLCLLMTVQRGNLHEVPGVVRLARDLGLINVRLSPCYGPAPYALHGAYPAGEIRRTADEALRLGKEYGIKVDLVGTFGSAEEKGLSLALRQRCDHPWTMLHVTADGSLGPCCHLIDPPLRLGRLGEGGFTAAWNSTGFQLFRKLIHTQNRHCFCDRCFRTRYSD